MGVPGATAPQQTTASEPSDTDANNADANDADTSDAHEEVDSADRASDAGADAPGSDPRSDAHPRSVASLQEALAPQAMPTEKIDAPERPRGGDESGGAQ